MMKLTLTKYMRYAAIASLCLAVGVSQTAFAAEKDKASRRAALLMQKMKQDMEAEKAAIQAQFDTQKKELEDKLKSKDDELAKSDKKLAVAERKNRSLEGEVAKLNTDKAAIEANQQKTLASLEATQKSLDEVKTQHAQAQADLKFNDGQRKAQSTNLAQTNKFLNECEDKNGQLYQFGTEIIQLYDKPGRYEAAMRQENFFQLKRVELENILQNYQDKVDAARYVDKKSTN